MTSATQCGPASSRYSHALPTSVFAAEIASGMAKNRTTRRMLQSALPIQGNGGLVFWKRCP
jgi:hypothetical protein